MLEHLSDALVGLGRALEILVGADLLTDLLALVTCVSNGEKMNDGWPC